jgi:hypothetical protein
MRRAAGLAALGGLVLWLARRARRRSAEHGELVSVGFTDGSATTLEVGSPERELLMALAAEAL